MTRVPRVAHITTVDLTLRFLLLPQLRRLRAEGYDVTGISAPGPWTAELEAEGIRHVDWPHASRAWHPLADAQAFAELLAILRRERFALIHTHNPKPGVLGRIAARLVGAPVVVNTVHGLYATPEDRAAKRYPVLAVERVAARFSDLELYQSEEDLLWARRIGLARPSRSAWLGNGVNIRRFDPGTVSRTRRAEVRRQLGIPDDAVVLVTVGRLVAEKGYRELFAAAREVRRKHPHARFLVIGSPDADKADAISDAELERARPEVVFAGWRADVHDLLGAADAFVLPSWREGVPRSAIEAAAMGLPLVLTDIRGCREVARHGVEGLLVPVRAPHALSSAISRLVGDPSLRARLGRAARRRAVERFDERRVEDTIVRAYRRLLRSKGLAAPAPRGSPDGIRIREASRRDAEVMSRLHRERLPDAFLPLLGGRFLRLMYRAVIEDPSGVALIAENDEGVVGFAAGTPSVEEFYRRFRRRYGIRAAVAVSHRLIHRDVRRRFRETSAYPDRTGDLPPAELLAIAVDPVHLSRGVGTSLARGVLDGLSSGGAVEVRVTVAAKNEAANEFYSRLGFRLARTIAVHEGVPSNVWIIRWPSSLVSSSPRS
jgi:glycosyltransferase involved in cell wall biosynthesis/ribosomal protein S18 acetylase RimI-like enzyme